MTRIHELHSERWSPAVQSDPIATLALDNSPAGILDYVATYFGMHVPIVGKRAPSTVDEMVDMKQAGEGTFEGGATRLEMNDGHTVFTDLRVRAKDVKFVVEKLSAKVFPNGRF